MVGQHLGARVGSAPPSGDEVLGQMVLGRYRIVRRLARGGMGVVYLARTEGAAGFTRPAVVKRILPDLTGDDKMTQMFVREARIMSYLHHPGIVGVLDFGEEDGAYIMVLEYVHGFHLGKWYRFAHACHGNFPAVAAIHIVIKVLEALHYAHTLRRPDGENLNIVHRDISPSNVLLDCDGNIKLADFGIARIAGETQVFKTEETTVKGKFPYLAPELFTGHPASVQTDLYSCGVVLHELLLGRNDFRGREIAETIHRAFTHMPTLEYIHRSDVPSAIGEVILKAIAKNPAERFQTAGEFAAALRAIRPATEEQASATLSQLVRRDFLGDMPTKLGVDPLSVLDTAWREGHVEALSARPRAPRNSVSAVVESKGLAGPATSYPASMPPPRRKAFWPILAAGLLIASAGGITFALTKRDRAAQNSGNAKVIVVQKEEQEGAATDELLDSYPEALDDVTPAEEPEPPKQTQRRAPRRASSTNTKGSSAPEKPVSRAQALSATFARRQNKIHGCFSKHAQSMKTSPKLSIRLEVNRSGNVTSATLLPAAVGATPLGRCITAVAKNTTFGPQPNTVKFRIPIRAKIVK